MLTAMRIAIFFLVVCLTTTQAAWREPVRAPHAMVASTERTTSQIGVDVMKRGGNAVDAAVAVGLPWRSFIRRRGISAAGDSC